MVGIETDRGPWVDALVAAGYQVYAINPAQVARYRERHSTSGAKSNRGMRTCWLSWCVWTVPRIARSLGTVTWPRRSSWSPCPSDPDLGPPLASVAPAGGAGPGKRRLGRPRRRQRASRGDRGGVGSLTRRELEIAELVRAGRTNRAIAAELFLSEKTVETHLRHIFGKLGVASRASVARALEGTRATQR
jgi:DNA-binding CsgD family transcriptional regulator